MIDRSGYELTVSDGPLLPNAMTLRFISHDHTFEVDLTGEPNPVEKVRSALNEHVAKCEAARRAPYAIVTRERSPGVHRMKLAVARWAVLKLADRLPLPTVVALWALIDGV